MRLVFANPDIGEEDLDKLFDHYLEAAHIVQQHQLSKNTA
jgi:hypothetical protein